MSHTPGPDVSRLRVLAVLPCAVALLGALNAPACAQDKGSIFAGGSVGEDRSAFLGGSIALPGATLGHGPAARAILSGGDYHYDSGGQEIKGDYGAADLALLYQFSGAWGYANIGGGAHYADTDLSPNDPGNQRQGSHWDAMVTADGARNMGDFRATAFGSYVFDVEDYYVRADLTRGPRGHAPRRRGRGAGRPQLSAPDGRAGGRLRARQQLGDPPLGRLQRQRHAQRRLRRPALQPRLLSKAFV
jgi:hypothetical protein